MSTNGQRLTGGSGSDLTRRPIGTCEVKAAMPAHAAVAASSAVEQEVELQDVSAATPEKVVPGAGGTSGTMDEKEITMVRWHGAWKGPREMVKGGQHGHCRVERS